MRGEKTEPEAEQRHADREEYIVEAAHEAEALLVGVFGGAPRLLHRNARKASPASRSRFRRRLRVEVVLAQHHSFSTVTLRLV